MTKSDSVEPPTKLIKLIGNNAILAPIDKDNKVMHSGHITLQQVMQLFSMLTEVKRNINIFVFKVVGGGGLVVSPIHVVTSNQNLKFIGQPNGLTTIELNAPPCKYLRLSILCVGYLKLSIFFSEEPHEEQH